MKRVRATDAAPVPKLRPFFREGCSLAHSEFLHEWMKIRWSPKFVRTAERGQTAPVCSRAERGPRMVRSARTWTIDAPRLFPEHDSVKLHHHLATREVAKVTAA